MLANLIRTDWLSITLHMLQNAISVTVTINACNTGLCIDIVHLVAKKHKTSIAGDAKQLLITPLVR